MRQYSMTIGGESVAGNATFDVVNPATAEVHAAAPECEAEQLDAAFAAAHQAYGTWRKNERARRRALHAAADLLMRRTDQLAPVLTAEQGKPLKDAAFEIAGAGWWLKHFADMPLPHEVIRDDAEARVEVVRRPMGVVAAITPWNFPLMLACWKLGPALLAGNTVVLKPSPYTPLTTLALGELLREVLPPGVVNVVSGSDPLGARMTAHPVPRKISFTGSVATGKEVAAVAAGDLKRVTLELGGNDPAIVLDDADPRAVAPHLFQHAFENNGQLCSAIKRVYVSERRHDDLVEVMAKLAREAKVGNGFDDGVRFGPINNEPQFERIVELVEDARGRGATVAAGGGPLEGPGYFYRPTVLADVDDSVRVVHEEQFGPVLPIVRYTSLDEVIARANESHFGLDGSVWGTDTDRAAEVAAALECGTTWVNTHFSVHPGQPFGGHKWSGVGVENGRLGLEAFTEVQVRSRHKGNVA
ncbi:aldehyde dehydrogenase family protein [Streptomyces reniochalinae]|uniref:Aldehyde dehydrogenase family protein n=1 Tax=Streptomyces reniochalinae TaxID=2250578 RepID=A0A367EEK7_9ACTN|nr:aldehyde dehydrogenase family protein [Streptomyces reniochalinae]RCG16172.1 aldehyde dehydrogenase family protein [Streptomyces reniochalinae]